MDWWYPVTTIFAIIVGPILAVQVQKCIERRSENKKRKEKIFKILMATRAAALSPDHVRALNMIEVEFQGHKEVLDAWREYFSHLGEEVKQETMPIWLMKKTDLLANLLRVMAKELGYSFDNVSLKKGAYLPIGHDRWELGNQIIRNQLVQILTGKEPLQVTSVPADKDLGKIAQDAFIDILTGKQSIKIEVVGQEGSVSASASASPFKNTVSRGSSEK